MFSAERQCDHPNKPCSLKMPSACVAVQYVFKGTVLGLCVTVFFSPLYFSLVTICMYYQYFDIRDEPPLPSKFCLKKKKKVPGKRNFLWGVHFLCKYVSSAWKGETSFRLCCTHHRRKSLKRKLALVSMLPSNNLLIRACTLSHFRHVWLCDPVYCSLPASSVHGITRQE